MSTLTVEIDKFVNGHIGQGQDTVTVEKEIISILAQKELDRNLLLAEGDIKNGRTKKVNRKWKTDFVENLKKQILRNQ